MMTRSTWVEKGALLGRHALNRGDSVKFSPFAHEKGPRALAVRVVEAPARRGPRATDVHWSRVMPRALSVGPSLLDDGLLVRVLESVPAEPRG